MQWWVLCDTWPLLAGDCAKGSGTNSTRSRWCSGDEDPWTPLGDNVLTHHPVLLKFSLTMEDLFSKFYFIIRVHVNTSVFVSGFCTNALRHPL